MKRLNLGHAVDTGKQRNVLTSSAVNLAANFQVVLLDLGFEHGRGGF